jgi:hypothetical protein
VTIECDHHAGCTNLDGLFAHLANHRTVTKVHTVIGADSDHATTLTNGCYDRRTSRFYDHLHVVSR